MSLGALPGEEFLSTFDPRTSATAPLPALKRPQFLGIVASATLAMTLAKKANGRVDGFVVEGDTAGGHNAPPRGPMQLSASGEPVYGERDAADLEKIRELGLPFWLAGSYGRPGKLAEALRLGAGGNPSRHGLCVLRRIRPPARLKHQAIQLSRAGTARVFTDPVASPTGFPFKVVQMDGTLSDADQYAARTRICDLGYLRHLYRKPDGTPGYRCPGRTGGRFCQKRRNGRRRPRPQMPLQWTGRQRRPQPGASGTGQELALMTAGDDVANIAQFLEPGCDSYTAADVLRHLLDEALPVNGTALPAAQLETVPT